MKTQNDLISDDVLARALLRQPSSGLAELVASDLAQDIAVTTQDRRRVLRWPWAGEPSIGLSPRTRRVLWVAAVLALVVGLLVSIALVGAWLRRPTLLVNGSIAFAPPQGGLVILGADGRAVSTASDDTASFPAWSPDGSRMAYWSGSGHAWVMEILDVRSGAITRPIKIGIPATLEPNGLLQWSTDGRRILADALAAGSPTVLIADVDAGTYRRIGSADMDTMMPAWSADGRRLAYVGERRFSNDWRIYLADSDGDHPVENRLFFPAGVGVPSANGDQSMQLGYPISWSPDSSALLITGSSSAYDTMLFTERIADGTMTALTPRSVSPHLSRWSPDGSAIAFSSWDDVVQASDIFVMDADGSDLHLVPGHPCGFVDWSPDGSRLVFDEGLCDSNAQSMAIRTVKIDGTGLGTVWSMPRTTGFPARTYGDSLSVSWQGLRP